MYTQLIKVLIGGVLLLHGLGHGGAIGPLIWIGRKPGTDTGGWLAARSWLLPSLSGPAAALSFWGILLPCGLWRQLATATAVLSALGIVLFFGTWPTFNALAALAVNIAVLVTQLWLRWPPQAMSGK